MIEIKAGLTNFQRFPRKISKALLKVRNDSTIFNSFMEIRGADLESESESSLSSLSDDKFDPWLGASLPKPSHACSCRKYLSSLSAHNSS
jgi:hypothetical protein